MSQLRVDEITDEPGTGSPSFPNGVDATELVGDIAADRMKDGFNASGSAPVYACRAWVNFNGANASIRASGNVSSVTRNATGRYTVNFTTAMPDANYAALSAVNETLNDDGNFRRGTTINFFTASSVGVFSFDPLSSNLQDLPAIHVSIFR